MARILTLSDLQTLLRQGEPVPTDVRFTPAAQDLLAQHRAREVKRSKTAAAPSNSSATGPAVVAWKPGADPRSPDELETFFHSPPLLALKRQICDIGHRLWLREYTDGNGGNITVRVGDNLVLCTPTLISKGFMQPEDLCLIDLEGRQLLGRRPRTSEALTHLGIMRRQPKAIACVHAHPPHATAFAIADATLPTCLIPEAEVFLGKIGIAEYRTPGTPENADEVGRIGAEHQAVLMRNHGVIVWGDAVEDACWRMENLDAYCRTIWIARSLGGGNLNRFSSEKLRELIALRQKLGMTDQRAELHGCDLCRDEPLSARSGADAAPVTPAELPPEQFERLVHRVTAEIMRRLSSL